MNRILVNLIKPRVFMGFVFIALVGIVLAYLAYTNKLTPLVEYLDSDQMSLELGANRFSVYGVTKAILIIVGLLWLAGMVSHAVDTRIGKLGKLRTGNRALLSKGIQIFIYFIAFVIGVHALGINMASLAVLGGTIGIGIGFGLQKITSNFISGLILLFEKSLEGGDLIELQGGVLGYVRQTHARYTLIETLDGKEVMVPNENFIINEVTNLSYSDTKGRMDVLVGVSYDSDTDLALDIMLDAAKAHPRVLDDPQPAGYMTQFADSSINLALYFWIGDMTHERMGPKSDIMREIFRRFNEEGITIPFPQRDVHLIPQPEGNQSS